MSATAELDFSRLPSGPTLLLGNAFRLAQMPVDANDRKLSRRQQRIDRANQLGMALPPGDCPIFSEDAAGDENKLKEALHRISDPVSRLFDELFWFWPRTFGDGANDEGLRLLSSHEIDAALALWTKHESETQDFVATHNLALLHQYLALESDRRLIDTDQPVPAVKKGLFGFATDTKGEDNTTRGHWQQAFERWALLADHEPFWSFLRQRIQAIDNPRLPITAAAELKQHLAEIILSVNVGLMVRAARRGLKDHIDRQRSILNHSGFAANRVEKAYDAAAKDNRQRIAHLCQTVTSGAKAQPLTAGASVRDFVTQTTPMLRLLDDLYANGNPAVDAVYDEVAESIRRAQIAASAKTEDWEEALELLDLALPFARSEGTQKLIADDIEVVKSNLESDVRWCQKGYFDLPDPCVELLEQAREEKTLTHFSQALSLLRSALRGTVEIAHHPQFRKHVIHCLAYVLKDKAIAEYNLALNNFDNTALGLLRDSVRYQGYVSETSAACCGCGRPIFGSYVLRTIQDEKYPFCNPCSASVDRSIDALQVKFDESRAQALNEMVLADYFNPGNKSIEHNLSIVREAAHDRGLRAKDPDALRMEWALLDAQELIALLSERRVERDVAFQQLSRLVTDQQDGERQETLSALFATLFSTTDLLRELVPIICDDEYIFSQFIKYWLTTSVSAPEQANAALQAIVALDDHRTKFAIIESIERQVDGTPPFSAEILASLEHNVRALVSAAGSLSSFTDGELGDLLSRAATRSQRLEQALIAHAIETASELESGCDFGTLIRAVHDAPHVLPLFYAAVFAGGDALSTQSKEQLIEALLACADPVAQFSVLETLKERGDCSNSLLARIEAHVCDSFVERAKASLRAQPLNWTDGDIGKVLAYAASYRIDFEDQLFTMLIDAVDSRQSAGEFLKALSLVGSDCQRFMAMMNGSRPGLSTASKAIYVPLLSAHWDAQMRLFALRWFLEQNEEAARTAIVLTRFLADEDESVRALAASELERRADALVANGLTALCTENTTQSEALRTIVSSYTPRRGQASVSMGELIHLIGLVCEPDLLAFIRGAITTMYPTPSASPTRRRDLGILRYLAAHGTHEQSRLATELAPRVLGTTLFVRRRSAGFAMLRPLQGDPWWLHHVLEAPETPSTEVRAPRDARLDLGEQLPQLPASRTHGGHTGNRKHVLELARRMAKQPYVTCPVCKVSVRPKNLIRHYDKVHAGEREMKVAAFVAADADFPADSISRPLADETPQLVEAVKGGEARTLRPLLRWAAVMVIAMGLGYLYINDNPVMKQGLTLAQDASKVALEIAQHISEMLVGAPGDAPVLAETDTQEAVPESTALVAPPGVAASSTIADSQIAVARELWLSDGRSTHRIEIRDLAGRNVRLVAESTSPLTSPTWSPNGELLAYVARERGRARIWIHNVITGAHNAASDFVDSDTVPSWSPNGALIAYVASEQEHARIWIHNIFSGARDVASDDAGSNAAPSWSPDGRQLVWVSSIDGNADIYVFDTLTRRRSRLTHHGAIDNEPSWSPDGRSIVFTSARSGTAQIYQMSLNDPKPRRLTFDHEVNRAPTLSPNGRQLTYLRGRTPGKYQVAILDLGSNAARVLTNVNNAQSPTFSPNGQSILYIAADAHKGTRIAEVSIDSGLERTILADSGVIRGLDWSPTASHVPFAVAAPQHPRPSAAINAASSDASDLARSVTRAVDTLERTNRTTLEPIASAVEMAPSSELGPKPSQVTEPKPERAPKLEPEPQPEPEPIVIGANEIREAQRRLLTLGYDPGPIDGLWGSKTRRAMQRFQSQNGLKPTQTLDAVTLRALRAQQTGASKRQRSVAKQDSARSDNQRLQEALAAKAQAAHLAAVEAARQHASKAQTAREMKVYQGRILQNIRSRWVRPNNLPAGLKCELYVEQAPNGAVLKVRVVSASGNAAFDQSWVRAVRAASPLPTPTDPSLFRGKLKIPFRSVNG